MNHPRRSMRLEVLALLLITAASQAATPSDAIGTYQGGGRACYGTLTIRKSSISWRTPFSTCNNAPIVSTKTEDKNGARNYNFQLKKALSRSCHYTDIVLIEHTVDATNKTWEAIGYPTYTDQEAGRRENALSCPLIRLK